MRSRWVVAGVAVLALSLVPRANASQTVYDLNSGGLAGFNAAAGNPPISINFDGIAAGTNIGGTTINNVTFTQTGAPLIVVKAFDTVTDAGYTGVINAATNVLTPTSGLNVLSPGGIHMAPGSNPTLENDSLSLTFITPVTAFGFDHLSQSADGASFTSITVFDTSNVQLFSGSIPISNIGGIGGGAPAGADFWGIVSTTANIKSIVITEGDDNAQFPDSNIGYDSFRIVTPVPEPASLCLMLLGGTAILIRRRPRH